MELHLQSAPPAFAASCRALAALPRARLVALARRRAALGAAAGANADADAEGADAARAVDFVLRGAAAPPPQASGASPRAGAAAAAAAAAATAAAPLDAKALATALSRFSDLPRAAIEALVEGAVAGAAAAATATAAGAGAGAGAGAAADAVPGESAAARAELLGVDWALGLTVSSSCSPSVQRPFVSLQLHVRRADGALGSESVELSLTQLRALEAQLAEAAGALERA
jgi:hypothetical protein